MGAPGRAGGADVSVAVVRHPWPPGPVSPLRVGEGQHHVWLLQATTVSDLEPDDCGFLSCFQRSFVSVLTFAPGSLEPHGPPG